MKSPKGVLVLAAMTILAGCATQAERHASAVKKYLSENSELASSVDAFYSSYVGKDKSQVVNELGLDLGKAWTVGNSDLVIPFEPYCSLAVYVASSDNRVIGLYLPKKNYKRYKGQEIVQVPGGLVQDSRTKELYIQNGRLFAVDAYDNHAYFDSVGSCKRFVSLMQKSK